MWLDSKPTLLHIEELVCSRVASSWDRLALHLGVEQTVIDAVKCNHRRHCDEASRDVLSRWLHGERDTGSRQRTWRSILTALRESGEQELAEQLRTEWFRYMEAYRVTSTHISIHTIPHIHH